MDAALGEDFEFIRVIGAGSVATVFLARERALSRLVAIKVMHPEVATGETTRRRFEREAKAMASLAGNRNVVPVYRFGRLPDEAPYMVMRFVKGRSLQELIEGEGRLEMERGLDVLAGVAHALDEAHGKGIVHRDVRPGNVLWDEESGSALLTDFGIAAVLATGEKQSTRLTAVGELLGDTRYLSPEQLLDQELTEMVDIYSFGVMAYETLTGEGPYEAKSAVDRVNAHLTGTPRDPRALRPEIPAPVGELLQRCLSREPRHRPTAAAVVKGLSGGPGSGGGGLTNADSGGEVSDIQTLLKRKVPQVVLGTAAFGYVLTEVASNLADRSAAVRDSAYLASWVVAGAAVLGAAVIAWFHGEEGRQRAPVIEWILLSSIGVVGVALSLWIYLAG